MKGIFVWLKDSSKMKRWIMLILIGVVFASFGMANILVSQESITFMQAIKIIVYFVIGFTFVVLGVVYINKRNMELFIEATDDRLENKNEVNVNSLIFNKKVYDKGPKIVVIGGGSGLNTTVEGLKKHTSNITAVVTVSDYGEAFGQDNNKMLYRQLEDIKNSIGALSYSDGGEIQNLLNYEFNQESLKRFFFFRFVFCCNDRFIKRNCRSN